MVENLKSLLGQSYLNFFKSIFVSCFSNHLFIWISVDAQKDYHLKLEITPAWTPEIPYTPPIVETPKRPLPTRRTTPFRPRTRAPPPPGSRYNSQLIVNESYLHCNNYHIGTE